MEYPKLPEDFKKKWIEVLRSGEYKQAHFKLFDGIGYCCLGVACSISGYRDGELSSRYTINPQFFSRVPIELQGENETISELITLNDTLDSNFNQIADWIEVNL